MLIFGVTSGGLFTSADPDVNSIYAGTGITDSVQRRAINDLVTSLKDENLWTKLYALYGAVGGNVDACKINYINPDPLSTFTLSFNGGWTFDSTGMTPNGTSGWADTNFDASVEASATNISLGFYAGSTPTSPYLGVDFGCLDNSITNILQLAVRKSSDSGNFSCGLFSGSEFVTSAGVTTIPGLHVGASNPLDLSIYYDGADVSSLSTSTTNVPTGVTLALGGRKSKTLGYPDVYGSIKCQGAFIGQHLDSTEVATITSILDIFQTDLGR